MDSVKKFVMGVLLNLSEPVMSDILVKLEMCGVTSVDDLQFIEERDLTSCKLTTIQIRRIIHAAKSSRQDQFAPQDYVVFSPHQPDNLPTQHHAQLNIQTKSAQNEMSKDMRQLLKDNYKLLLRSLVVSDGLLFHLSDYSFLNEKITELQQKEPNERMAAHILSIIRKVPEDQENKFFNEFLSALRSDGQEHVANIFRPESDARPMSDDHYILMVTKETQVCQCLDLLHELIDELIRQHYEFFTESELNYITSRKTHEDSSNEIVRILRRKPDTAYQMFINALCATNQHHVAGLLGYDTNKIPMTPAHRELLIRNRGELYQAMDPSYELLSELVAAGIFSDRDRDHAEKRPSYNEMALDIINILLRKSDCSFEKFVEALNNTEQHHVVYILTGQGESQLSRLRRSVLNEARKDLIKKVDVMHTSLVAELISSGVLTDADRERIEAQQINEDMMSTLLNIMLRKSQSAFDKFIQALTDSGHCLVAEALNGLELRGEISPIFRAGISETQKTRTFQSVYRAMEEDLIRGKEDHPNKLTTIMLENGIAISSIRQGSIKISIRCYTEESLANLMRLYANKTLDKLITEAFGVKFRKEGLESLSLTIGDDEFRKCKEALKKRSDDQRKQCVVFIDDSNIYIEGQKYFAQLHKLLVPQDPRCRIDIGKLLEIALCGRDKCSGSALYGSEPPARDTVWTSIRKSGLIVKTYHKNTKGKEKEVATALTADAIEYTCKHKDEVGHQTVVIVAGDRDYCPTVKSITDNGWKVEILAFSSSISNNLEKMQGERCTIFKLDDLLKTQDRSCCYVETKWFFKKFMLPPDMTQVMELDREIDPEKDKIKVKKLVDEITAITRVPIYYHLSPKNRKLVFIIGYLPKTESQETEQVNTRPMAVEKTTRAIKAISKAVLQQQQQACETTRSEFFVIWKRHRKRIEDKCREIGICEHVSCTDLMTFRQSSSNDEDIQTENRYSVLADEGFGESDSDDDEDYSLLKANIVDRSSVQKSEVEEEDAHEFDASGLIEVKRRQKKEQRNYSDECGHRFSCRNGSQCRYKHTSVEMEFFKVHGGKGVMGYKSKPCYHHISRRCQYGIKEIAPMCAYYHSTAEAHCYKCKVSGHAAHDKAGPVCSKLE